MLCAGVSSSSSSRRRRRRRKRIDTTPPCLNRHNVHILTKYLSSIVNVSLLLNSWHIESVLIAPSNSTNTRN
jgi:hypothetical protein